MKPEEINRQIGIEVMGWTVNGNVYDTTEKIVTLVEDWKPSTNISHAFEVVEKMMETFGTFEMERILNLQDEAVWWVIFYEDGLGSDAETLSMAICLAALEAVKDQA